LVFFDNPVIQKLAHSPRWTVNVENKMPIDMQTLKTSGRIFGATGEHSLTTLPELLDVFQQMQMLPSQFVYFLDAERDGFIVLDIEPACPDVIRNDLLNLDFIYGDISASGNGYHLVFECPPLNEVTRRKRVMKHPDKYYEILLHHYVTFTQNIILPTQVPSAKSFLTIWNELAAIQKTAVTSSLTVNAVERPTFDNPIQQKLYEKIIEAFKNRFNKTPANYNGDVSRYEFGVIGAVRSYMRQMLEFSLFEDIVMDENEEIWMVYDIVSEVLEHRDKHDERRGGQPFLFYLVCRSFATSYT
jgi:hypothetical protein